MGDRANLIIHMEAPNPPVWIYTHWNGTELPDMLATALELPAAVSRVGDPAYFARIVFCSFMHQTDDLDGGTGWGISTCEQDNEHDYIHLDAMTGAVAITGKPERPAPDDFMDRETYIATCAAIANA